MTVRYQFDPHDGVAIVTIGGVVTGSDIIAATDALVEQPEYRGDYHQVWVFTDVVSLAISPEEMEAMVAHDLELVDTGVMGAVRVAIVVSGTMRVLAARLYQHHLESAGQSLRIFESPAQAIAWVRQGTREFHLERNATPVQAPHARAYA